MSKSRKKQAKNINLILGAIIVLLLCILIALICFNHRSNINEVDVVLYADSENITIDDSLPINDQFGKTISDDINGGYKTVDFDIVNVSSKAETYQIYITKNNLNTNEINNDYVKFYLTDDKSNPVGVFEQNKVPSYNNLSYIKDKASSKLLYTGKIDKYQKKKFNIKVWVTDNYVSSMGNYFSFDIGVRSV